MAFDLRLKRGTTAKVQAYTGNLGELVIDSEKLTVSVQDGVTAGGHLLAREDDTRIVNAVQNTLKVNGNALSGDINVKFEDLDALPTTLAGFGITDAINVDRIGVAEGIAPLNINGLIDEQYLPSYVDDVLEFDELSDFPVDGETGKIYVALDSGKIYRWTGSQYIEINANVGSADEALKLAEEREIALTGDATGSVDFDGSKDVEIAVTLADSGVSAGSYSRVTVDAKGRVTAGDTKAQTITFDSGTTAGVDSYVFDGSADTSFNIKAGVGISLTKTANEVVINSGLDISGTPVDGDILKFDSVSGKWATVSSLDCGELA